MNNVAMDLISDLPDEVLVYILSFLSTKEAVQTCVLAKRWRKTWASVPVLKFYLDEFLTDKADFDNYEIQRGCENKFEQFVNGVLDKRGPSQLEMFQCLAYIGDNYSEASLEWLDRVSLLMPRVISVSVDRENAFDFPDSVFSCASLQKLHLNILTHDITIISPKSIHLPSLKMLEIQSVELDDNFAQKLFRGCPALEFLLLSCCDLAISDISCNMLKKLVFFECWQFRQMRISCPSLESLVIQSNDQDGGISLENMVSLVKAKICLDLSYDTDRDMNLLRGLSNVSTLILGLYDASFKDILEDDIANCRTFTNLTRLEIAHWNPCYDFYFVACILKHSPSLQELTLHLNKLREVKLEDEPRKKKPREAVFQRDHLKVIRITKSRIPDVLVNQLINNLRAHIKIIGKLIIS